MDSLLYERFEDRGEVFVFAIVDWCQRMISTRIGLAVDRVRLTRIQAPLARKLPLLIPERINALEMRIDLIKLLPEYPAGTCSWVCHLAHMNLSVQYQWDASLTTMRGDDEIYMLNKK